MIHSFSNSRVKVCFLSNASLLESTIKDGKVKTNTASYHDNLFNIYGGFRVVRWSLFGVVLRIISSVAWPIHCVSVMKGVLDVREQVA
jgi:hypothetical protein